MINFNGVLEQKENSPLDPYNRGMLYGDGIFETIKAVNGKLLFWEDHYFRLMSGMRILRMDIPMEFTPEFLEEELKKTLVANNLDKETARIRLTVFRSGGGAYLPEERGVGYYAFAKAHKSPFYLLKEDPYEVELYKDHYVNADLI